MLLTMQEQQRIEVMEAVMDGRMTVEDAGRVLERSVRQIYRLVGRLRARGLAGLVHGNKGRRSPRRIGEAIRHRIVALVRGRLADINDTHLAEVLWREEQIQVSRQAVRKILRAAAIPAKLRRRRSKHRSRRERKAAFGMMLQIDASPHDWLEGRGPSLTLIGAKDDATGHVWARFAAAETTWGYLELLREIVLERGLPLSLYSDRHLIFHSPKTPTVVEQLHQIRPLTQFGRAMEELGITLIKAWSAPAKGRIENQWKTFQDRLVVELRLKGVTTRAAAHAMLRTFLQDYNRRFTVRPRHQDPVFRPSPPAPILDRCLCLKEIRTVAKDHTVSFEGVVWQIPPGKKYWSIARQPVQVLQLRDGSVEIVYQQQTVARFRPAAVTRLVAAFNEEKCALKKAA